MWIHKMFGALVYFHYLESKSRLRNSKNGYIPAVSAIMGNKKREKKKGERTYHSCILQGANRVWKMHVEQQE